MTHRRRKEFSAQTKREAHERSNGFCECHRIPGWAGCGVRLVPGAIFYEHINPDFISSDNSLENCACICKTCFLIKTNGYDKPVIAKVKRAGDRVRNIRPIVERPLPGTYASGLKHFMAGGWAQR